MIKVIVVLKKLDSITQEEFNDHWLTIHAPLVSEVLPGLLKYVTNTRVESRNKNRVWDFDGVSELWFEDTESYKKAWQSEGADRIREDEKTFLKSTVWIMTEETLIVDRTV